MVMSSNGFTASAPVYGTPLPHKLSGTLDGACPIVANFGRRGPWASARPLGRER